MNTKDINYSTTRINVKRASLLDNLEFVLKPKRYEHVLRVEAKALELAEIYDYKDLEAVSIAALMHDYCKQFASESMLELARQMEPADWLPTAGDFIWHGLAAAQLAQQLYDIKDDEIIQAIAEHTIGAAEMSRLSQIIFVADYIEDGRDFPGVKEARRLAKKSLEEAVLYKMQATIIHLAENHEAILLESVANYNAYLKKLPNLKEE